MKRADSSGGGPLGCGRITHPAVTKFFAHSNQELWMELFFDTMLYNISGIVAEELHKQLAEV